MFVGKTLTFLVIFCYFLSFYCNGERVGEIDIKAYREKAKQMFYHAYNGYLNHAYPYDELQPLTCKGHDTWGSYSLTLIDALDTLVVMGNHSEFRRIAQLLIDKGESFFDMDINASVFETNIRIVGGLLSAHLLMSRAEMVLEPAWPCSGPLLRMAENIARKILPAFDTPTGMPYGTVNLRHGVPKGETTVTCTAGVGTFLIEFGTLSRLTGDPIFEKTAVRAIRSLWKFRSPLGLLGNHIDVSTGKWTALDSGIGGGVDSYFEYLVKGAVMFDVPEFLHMFREYEASIKRHTKRDDWYMWAHMQKGTISLPLFTSLDGYWPSIQSMLGDIDEAMKTMHNFHQVWRQFGFTPEYYNIPNADVHAGREGYPLRPEIIESAMYLYRATKDPYLLEIGVDILEGIENGARTSCGYATVKDVRDHRLEDRMESFFLAETAKYLYLLFDTDNFLHENGSRGQVVHTPGGACVLGAGGYVFNTEAHPLDLAAVHCCSAEKREEDRELQEMEDNLDLLGMLGLTEDDDEEEEEEMERELEGFWEEFKEDEAGRDKKRHLKEDDMRRAKERYMLDPKESCYKDGEDHCKESSVMDENDDEGDDFDEDDDTDFVDLGVDEEEEEDAEEEEEGLEVDLKKKGHSSVDGEHQHHQAQLVDMTQFTERERNFTHVFMERLELNTLLRNISAELAKKMRDSFKETEHEYVANNVARKLDAASTETEGKYNEDKQDSLDDVGKSSSKTYDESKKKEKLGMQKADSDGNSDLIIEGISDDDSDETIHDKIERQNNIDANSKSGKVKKAEKTEQKIVLVKIHTDGKTEEIHEPTDLKTQQSASAEESGNSESIGRFKHHIQQQLKKEDEKIQKQNNKETEASSPFLTKSPSPLDKRSNLLSLTTKLLQMFSPSSNNSEDNDDSSAENRSPSLAGLYTSLSNYSLNYFNDPFVMHCPSRPFHHRLSIYGEMFPDKT